MLSTSGAARGSLLHRLGLFAGLSCLSTLGCKRSAQLAPEVSSSAASKSAPSASASNAPVSAAASVQGAKRAAPRASAGTPVELTEAQKEAEIRYHAALERGRRATRTHDYDAAEKAFTEALTAKPNDARALGERGFAYLQADNLDFADSDFSDADGRTQDANLAAQIFFNQGLLAERKGDLESAKVSYTRSQQLHPTAAAKKKITDLHATSCTAAFVPLSQELKHYANWVEFWNTLGMMDKKTTEQDVKAGLFDVTPEDCKDVCAVSDGRLWHIVIPSESGLDVLRSVDRGGGDRCTGYPKFSFERHGSILIASSTNDDEAIDLCDPKCNGDEELCATCCVEGPAHRYDTFIDLNAHKATLRVSQYGAKSSTFTALPVTLDAQNTVHVTGGGCERTVSLAAK